VADLLELASVAIEKLVGLWSSFQGSGLSSVWAFRDRIFGQDREEFLIDPLAQLA
jgi:hypothetical protein